MLGRMSAIIDPTRCAELERVRGRTGILAVLSRRVAAWGTSSPCHECRVGPAAEGLNESFESLPGGTGNAFVGPASETGVIGVAQRVFASDEEDELEELVSEA